MKLFFLYQKERPDGKMFTIIRRNHASRIDISTISMPMLVLINFDVHPLFLLKEAILLAVVGHSKSC